MTLVANQFSSCADVVAQTNGTLDQLAGAAPSIGADETGGESVGTSLDLPPTDSRSHLLGGNERSENRPLFAGNPYQSPTAVSVPTNVWTRFLNSDCGGPARIERNPRRKSNDCWQGAGTFTTVCPLLHFRAVTSAVVATTSARKSPTESASASASSTSIEEGKPLQVVERWLELRWSPTNAGTMHGYSTWTSDDRLLAGTTMCCPMIGLASKATWSNSFHSAADLT